MFGRRRAAGGRSRQRQGAVPAVGRGRGAGAQFPRHRDRPKVRHVRGRPAGQAQSCETPRSFTATPSGCFASCCPTSSLAAVHVYFPDPWWKKRHHKRRVMNEAFLKDVVRTLVPGGTVPLLDRRRGILRRRARAGRRAHAARRPARRRRAPGRARPRLPHALRAPHAARGPARLSGRVPQGELSRGSTDFGELPSVRALRVEDSRVELAEVKS